MRKEYEQILNDLVPDRIVKTAGGPGSVSGLSIGQLVPMWDEDEGRYLDAVIKDIDHEQNTVDLTLASNDEEWYYDVSPDKIRLGKRVQAELMEDPSVGDLVNFGPYGNLYVVQNHGDTYWVTDQESDRLNPDARGWSIRAVYAEEIIEYADDLEDDNDYDDDEDDYNERDENAGY